MATTQHRLTKTTHVRAMRKYSRALEAIASANAEALADVLPDGDAAQLLSARRETLTLADDAWKSGGQALGDARIRRDRAESSATSTYARLYGRVKLQRRRTPDVEELTSIVRSSAAPSTVHALALVEAMKGFADRVTPHLAALASVNLTAAKLATLEGKRLALDQAEAELTAADTALSALSDLRTKARGALFTQIRVVEEALQLAEIPDNVRAALETARKRCLPRVTADAPEGAPEDEVLDEDEGDELDGDEPLPG